jgi:hypothetical protein
MMFRQELVGEVVTATAMQAGVPGLTPGLDVSYERTKLGVANTEAMCTCAQIRLPVWTRNCDRPSLTRGPDSLRLPCDVK